MRKKSVKKIIYTTNKQLSKMNTQPNNTPVQNTNQTQVQSNNTSTPYSQMNRQQKRAFLIKAAIMCPFVPCILCCLPCLGKITYTPNQQ